MAGYWNQLEPGSTVAIQPIPTARTGRQVFDGRDSMASNRNRLQPGSGRAREGCAKVDQERRPVGAISRPYSRSRWRPTHSTRHRFLSASGRFWPPVESDNAPASQPLRYDRTPVDVDRVGGDPGITIASSWSASMASGRGRVERESIRFRPVDGRRLADCRQVVSQIA